MREEECERGRGSGSWRGEGEEGRVRQKTHEAAAQGTQQVSSHRDEPQPPQSKCYHL